MRNKPWHERDLINRKPVKLPFSPFRRFEIEWVFKWRLDANVSNQLEMEKRIQECSALEIKSLLIKFIGWSRNRKPFRSDFKRIPDSNQMFASEHEKIK